MNKNAIKLTELERSVIKEFCISENLKNNNLDGQLDLIEVTRDFSPVGFFMSPNSLTPLQLMPRGVNFKGGKVGARINAEKIETGYLMFIEDGFLKTIEGYTYEEPWPKEILSIEVYNIGGVKGVQSEGQD